MAIRTGITVMPEYVQAEGVEAVLERVADVAGATSVTTSPYVVAVAPTGTGHREPPADAEAGKKRLLDRPLWGLRELWMNAASSFAPDLARYEGLAYRPPETDATTDMDGPVVGAFLDAAADRGLRTWMQIQAAIPPCHRVQFGGPTDGDQPLLPDGKPFKGRVDKNASLASADLRTYMRAFVGDLWRAYPRIGGVRFDWSEYPAYHFDSLFFDFNPQAARFAPGLGLDLEDVRRGCVAFLTELGDGSVRRRAIPLDGLDGFRAGLFAAYPALSELVALRTAIVTDYGRFLREIVDDVSGGRAEVFLQCFPPPLNEATGFDIAAQSRFADMIGVKAYTMHWPMIEADIMGALRTRADFAPEVVARALSRLLALSPDAPRDPEGIRYPDPDEAHPAASADIADKMRSARALVAPGTKMCGITHGYGPLEDVTRRFEAVAEGAAGRIEVNRYGYLSDAKLEAIGRLSRAK
jgi:hypothetical protein